MIVITLWLIGTTQEVKALIHLIHNIIICDIQSMIFSIEKWAASPRFRLAVSKYENLFELNNNKYYWPSAYPFTPLLIPYLLYIFLHYFPKSSYQPYNPSRIRPGLCPWGGENL